jgi:integrase
MSAATIHGSTLGDALHDRLVRAGLCKPRLEARPAELTLVQMLDAYVARRDDVKPGTQVIYGQARGHLVRHFGADRIVRAITAAEAGDFRRAMRRDYSEAYTAKIIIKARTFWRDAVDRKLVDANAFAKVQTGSQVNVARHRYIDAASIERVIAVCPDPQWKLLLALSRYAGLRCPSEHLALTWADVDWASGRMTVRACKTEHHAGGGVRVVPIFESLRPYLRVVFDLRDPGNPSVITRYRQANSNLRTQLIRYIRKAGLTPWPRLFHNLRASCQTDLAERFPSHVVCRWIGNSEAVAGDHYLQTTDVHFEKAIGQVAEKTLDRATKGDAESGAATSGTTPHELAPIDVLMLKTREILQVAKKCDLVQFEKWAVQGSNL